MSKMEDKFAGVILAGGRGTRLRPMTLVTNKHLLGVYDKPMIYYPIELLRDKFGIKDILIVSGGDHIGDFAELLGDGSGMGVEFTYRVQKDATGIAAALGLAKNFAARRPTVVVLGDNIFFDIKLPKLNPTKATLFLKQVDDPTRFGVVEWDEAGLIKGIVEKPKVPPSQYAVTGLYSYPPDVFDVVPTLVPSHRGELEVTDLNNHYINTDRCDVAEVDGFWSDAGTHDSLLNASAYVAMIKGVDSKNA